MTSRQILSSLSIAAVAFLVASVPCFAQTQSVESDKESCPAAITVVEPTVAWNRERANAESLPTSEDITTKSVTPAAAKVSQPNLSMSMFKQSVGQFSAGERLSFAPQSMIYDRVENSKKQFRADDDAGTAARPRVSFIPSRGPKLPD